MPQGIIEINKIRIYAHHGVIAQEHRVGNEFEVSAKLIYPIETAMSNDNISGTLNYAKVIEIIKSEMATPSNLLEHVIKRIHTSLITQYPLIKGGSITIAKLSPPIPNTQVTSVAVTYEW